MRERRKHITFIHTYNIHTFIHVIVVVVVVVVLVAVSFVVVLVVLVPVLFVLVLFVLFNLFLFLFCLFLFHLFLLFFCCFGCSSCRQLSLSMSDGEWEQYDPTKFGDDVVVGVNDTGDQGSRSTCDFAQVLSLMDPEPQMKEAAFAPRKVVRTLKLTMHRASGTAEELLQILSLALEMHHLPPIEQVRNAMQAAVDKAVPENLASNFIVVLEQLLARHPGLFAFLQPGVADVQAPMYLDVIYNLLHRNDIESTPGSLFVKVDPKSTKPKTALRFDSDQARSTSHRRTALCTLLLTWLRLRKLQTFKRKTVLQGYGSTANFCVASILETLLYVSSSSVLNVPRLRLASSCWGSNALRFLTTACVCVCVLCCFGATGMFEASTFAKKIQSLPMCTGIFCSFA